MAGRDEPTEGVEPPGGDDHSPRADPTHAAAGGTRARLDQRDLRHRCQPGAQRLDRQQAQRQHADLPVGLVLQARRRRRAQPQGPHRPDPGRDRQHDQLRTTGASTSRPLPARQHHIIIRGFTVDGGNTATGTTGAAAAISEQINGAVVLAGSDFVEFDRVTWDRLDGFGIILSSTAARSGRRTSRSTTRPSAVARWASPSSPAGGSRSCATHHRLGLHRDRPRARP